MQWLLASISIVCLMRGQALEVRRNKRAGTIEGWVHFQAAEPSTDNTRLLPEQEHSGY